MKRMLVPMLLGVMYSSMANAENLFDIYQLAIKNDPVTLKAKSDRDAAMDDVDVSRAPLLPQLSLNLLASKDEDFSHDGNLINRTNKTGELRLTQTLFDMSQWNNLDRTEMVAAQSDALYALTQQNLMLRTVDAYFGVLRAKDDLTFARAEKRAIARQLEQTKSRFSVGLTAITDVHEAQALFDNAVASEISAENNVEVSLEVLREITGRYHGNLSALDMERFFPHKPSPNQVEDWLVMATQGNFELLAAKLGVDISSQQIDFAKAGHYPTVTFSASATSGKQENIQFQFPSERIDTGSVAIQLSLPLYQGGGVKASTRAARDRYVSSSQELERIRRGVVRNVRSNYYNVVATISRIKALDQAVISAESAVKATEAGFEVGTRNIVEVLNSTRGLYDAKRNQAAARYQYITNILQLKQSAGSITEQDLLNINKGLFSVQ